MKVLVRNLKIKSQGNGFCKDEYEQIIVNMDNVVCVRPPFVSQRTYTMQMLLIKIETIGNPIEVYFDTMEDAKNEFDKLFKAQEKQPNELD